MPQRALRDTYVTEQVGTVAVRRRIMAGTILLPQQEAVVYEDVELTPDRRPGELRLGVHDRPEPVFDLKMATVDEMRAEARRRGIQIPGGLDKARRAQLLEVLA